MNSSNLRSSGRVRAVVAIAMALAATIGCAPKPSGSTGPVDSTPATDNLNSEASGSSATRKFAQAVAPSAWTLASTTPYAPFIGNQTVVVSPPSPEIGNLTSHVFLRRMADCSLTETLATSSSTAVQYATAVDLTGVGDYLRRLSGLPARTGPAFAAGCADRGLGQRSAGTPLTVTVTTGSVVLATINPSSEVLQLVTLDRATTTTTRTALTTVRVQSMRVADMNGDGLTDIVAAGVGYGVGTTGNVVVFLNNGDGTFRTATSTASSTSFFVIDDVNGDGKVDLVGNNGFDVNGTAIPGVTTLLGNGDGTFRAGVVTAAAITQTVGLMVTGDFNGDGKIDLVTGNSVVLGGGDGTFTTATPLPASIMSDVGFTAAVGDINRDGKADIAYTSLSGAVQLLLGVGDGTFTLGARYASVSPNGQVAITDMDGDGNPDVVVGTSGGGLFAPATTDAVTERIQVLLGRGDGTLVGAQVFSGAVQTNLSSQQIATGDFDGDGKIDMLMIDKATGAPLSVLPGDGHGALGTAISSTVGVTPFAFTAIDMNGDAKLDVVLAGQSKAGAMPMLAVATNLGGGQFGAERDYALPNFPISLAVADFDGDGHLDAVVGVSSSLFGSGVSGVYVLFGQTDGSLGAPVQVDASPRALGLVAADLNADGRAELVVADYGTSTANGTLKLYPGTAARSFTAAALPAITATRFTAVAVADMDGNGKPDLIVGASTAGASFGLIVPSVHTMLGNGDMTFRTPLAEPLIGPDGNGLNAIAAGDFNHDGRLDLALGNQADFTEILLGKGDGTYAHGILAIGQFPNTLATVDLDNDLYPELIVGAANGLALFRNVGTSAAWAGPASTTSPTTPTSPTSPAAIDFTLTETPSSGSVTAGQSAQTIIAAKPSTTDVQTVTLACSAGLPSGASCSFSPPTLSLTGGAAGSSSLTISTPKAAGIGAFFNGSAPGPSPGALTQAQGVLGFLMLALVLARGQGGMARARRIAGAVAMTSLLAACMWDSDDNAPAADAAVGTAYPVTVTATSGSVTHSVIYTLTVH